MQNLEQSLLFYRRVIGLETLQRINGTAELGTAERTLLELHENPQARRVSGVSGLYHFAILTPDRPALGAALGRLVQTQTPLQGFADHGVSEAIYLPDNEGNGIEIYRDRPRAEWHWQDGRLAMVSDPLDAQGVLEAGAERPALDGLLPEGTVIGHMHLHVGDLAQAEGFYRDVLGFDLMQHFGGSAAFLSAGGYHHHLGLNIWAGRGSPPAPPDAAGLLWYQVLLPDEASLDAALRRLEEAGMAAQKHPQGWLTRDPAGNGVLLTVEG